MALLRGLRHSTLRREILSALVPGRGMSADELRRRVATGRGLTPDSRGWPSFGASFSRALRLLDEAGVIAAQRDATIFQHACVTWVALTPEGERERERALPDATAHGLGALAPESSLIEDVRALLARATPNELASIERLVGIERSRRISAHP